VFSFTFLTFGGLCAIRLGWAWGSAPKIAQRFQNVNENTAS
jgi:hypothetical protein